MAVYYVFEYASGDYTQVCTLKIETVLLLV